MREKGILKNGGMKVLFFILFISAIKFFQNFPFEKEFFVFQAVVLVMLSGFLVFYIARHLLLDEPFDKFVLYLVFLAFFLPVYSAFRANLVFGQPILNGLFRERIWLTVLAGVVVIHFLSEKKWRLDDLRMIFIILAWASLLLFFMIYIFADPNLFDRSFVNFPTFKGIHYRLNPYFVVFGLIYYFLNYFQTKKTIYLLYFFLFLSYLVFFDKGRGMLVTVALTLLTIIVFLFRFKLRYYIVSLIILMILVLGVLSFFPGFSHSISKSFGQFTDMFHDHIDTPGSSIKARVFQIGKIKEFAKENPGVILWGSGYLSPRWESGFNGKFEYFYPPDLGILGVWFVYGLFGVVLVLAQMVFIKGGHQPVIPDENGLYYTLKFFILYQLLRSILTGIFFINPATFVIPAAVFYWIRVNGKESENNA